MLNIYLVLVILMNILVVAALLRLKVKHDETFSLLGLDKTTLGSPKQLAAFIEFVFTRKYAVLHDPLLTAIAVSFSLSFLAVLVIAVANLL